MSVKTEYTAGTPCWVDVSTPDLEAGRSFYSALFGWEPHVQENAGGYTLFTYKGHQVAGMGPVMNPAAPPSWSQYVKVDELEPAAEAVAAAGGQIVTPLMDIMDQGRMFGFMDPTGAYCAVWQPKAHIGCELVNEPTGFAWSEMTTRAPEEATAFYASVFGWTYAAEGPGAMEGYQVIRNGDAQVGGVMVMDERFPEMVPNHWNVYFCVEDATATGARCAELGGQVMVPTFPIGEIGEASMLLDPFGAAFTVMRINIEA